VLFIRGSFLQQDEWAVAVVGTRRASAYGRQVTETLASDLARRGITVVSGLARGIDAIAHRAALATGGRTFAVQACGLDLVYPPEHRQLALDITKQGALLSEFPPGTKPQAQHFPRRNRLMSGLCLGVLVIEADEQSGALITAHWALEQDREVFAVPGSIFSPLSRGTNNLIQRGEAKLVTSVDHILEELNLSLAEVQQKAREELSTGNTVAIKDEEALLLRVLSSEPQHIDEVAQQAGLPIAAASGTLALLELKGLVRAAGGMRYARVREPYPTYIPD
jgi:DNA processing protein